MTDTIPDTMDTKPTPPTPNNPISSKFQFLKFSPRFKSPPRAGPPSLRAHGKQGGGTPPRRSYRPVCAEQHSTVSECNTETRGRHTAARTLEQEDAHNSYTSRNGHADSTLRHGREGHEHQAAHGPPGHRDTARETSTGQDQDARLPEPTAAGN